MPSALRGAPARRARPRDGTGPPDLRIDEIGDGLEQSESPFGRVRHVAPVARLSETRPAPWATPGGPPGTREPAWSG
jgi:hypothetical protein